MWIFWKKFYRDLTESKGQFLSVLAVVMVGVMFYTGLNTAVSILGDSSEKFFRDYRLAHLWSSVHLAPEASVQRIESVPGVKKAEGRVVYDARLSLDDREISVRMISVSDEGTIPVNDVSLKSGSYFTPEAPNQCLVSEAFLKGNQLSLGQVIEPIIHGDRIKLRIVGTVQSPEYVFEVKGGSDIVSDPHRFGVIYVKKSFAQKILDLKGSVNDICVLLYDGSNIRQVKADMEKILKPYGLISTAERKDQPVYNAITSKISGLKSLSMIFPLLFFIASALIIYITMTRIVENQRTQMGVLKALGYGNGDIIFHYQTYPLLVGVLGSVAGSLLGMFVAGRGVAAIFNAAYHIPLEESQFHGEFILPAALLALVFCLAAGYNACRKQLTEVPAQSMRPKPPAAGQKIFLENIGPLWNKISFSWKIIIRNLFRYKKRSLLASVGVIFSMALLLVALGLSNSVRHAVAFQFSAIEKYDLEIKFSKILANDELGFIRNLSHVQSVEPVLATAMEISNGWVKKDIGLIALNPGSTLYGVLDQEGNPVRLPSEGIFLAERLMDHLGLHSGDKAYLRSFYPGKNEEKDKKEVHVHGSLRQYMGQSAVCSMEYLNYLLKEGVIANVAYLKLDDQRYEKETIEKLKDVLTINSIRSKSGALENTSKSLESLTSMIAFMILGACMLTFAVIFNMANINIFERRREIATLCVLGFTAKELRTLVFNENYFISLGGILAGIPLGRVLLDLVIRKAATENMQLPASMNASSYLLAALMVMALTVIANRMLTNKIQAINMVESLKSAE